MLVTSEGTKPNPIIPQKSLRINFSKGGFLVKIYNVNGAAKEIPVPIGDTQLDISADEISSIDAQQFLFRTEHGETHVNYEFY